MWGYSPNFNLKKQGRPSGLESMSSFRMSDEALREASARLQVKIQELRSHKGKSFCPSQAAEILELLQERSDLHNSEIVESA